MAGRPLRPATDRRLGGPLPRQPANQPSAAPSAPGLAVPGFHPQVSCGISHPFGWLSPTNGHVPMYYSPVRHSPPGASSRAAVRLACVKHAASVQSEPGSNSSVQSLFPLPAVSSTRRGSSPNESLAWNLQGMCFTHSSPFLLLMSMDSEVSLWNSSLAFLSTPGPTPIGSSSNF